MNGDLYVHKWPLMTLGRQIFLQAAGVSVVVGLAVTGIWMAERVDKFAVRRFFQSLGGGGGEKGRKGRSKPQTKGGGQASGGCTSVFPNRVHESRHHFQRRFTCTFAR